MVVHVGGRGPGHIARASRKYVFSEPFNATGAWSLDTGLAISGGTLNQTGASGTARSATLALPRLIDGRSYSVTFTLSNRTTGGVRINLAGTNGTLRLADGTYTETLVAGATGILSVLTTSTTNTGIAVDNIIIPEL